MAQVRKTKHSCDVCGRVAYTKEGRTADGWRKIKIWDEGVTGSEPESWQDTCDTCSSVLRDAITVRRRAEKGRHTEPVLREYPKTPGQADALAKTWLAKSDSE